ncbi:adenosylcobinamide-phosphate synthase CbiB [Anaerocolumna xylanovorans]|uniref:Cobalamin biosynthesis protein CobD n=1 Tax=Anaerocolumna xylanovorans DSM 12503 TaxID=1121345 RepID=A0A1M7XYR9_9FIRM|nr:adenosylcobinamide-phosphate synthase CbiB [Anaerocolumna xylanovorans]SHO44200.1 adenosylcobinamide-phosphate synthase [Anaerocolumna xylanovorans DSM 12503]
MIYHIAGFFAGFVLDLIFGDPYWLPHPVRWIGSLISKLDHGLFTEKEELKRDSKREFHRGILLVVLVLAITVLAAFLILYAAYKVSPYLGLAVESVMTYQILATKCLKKESMKVYKKLKENDLNGARKAVSMIVGRDTDCLDEEGVAKAAIETVAENTSDGVIAPMLYLAIGGPVLGFFYKAVNTLDSMVGYKNDRYLHFGRAAAKLDDALNFIPARISAILMVISCCLAGKEYNGKDALRIYKRDRRNHASPNSAHTEAACAGALGIRLAGDASYFGKVHHKPFIGDEKRTVECEDIARANRLLYITAGICQGICLIGLLLAAFAAACM